MGIIIIMCESVCGSVYEHVLCVAGLCVKYVKVCCVFGGNWYKCILWLWA